LKISGNRVDAFLKNRPAEVTAVLIFGPDRGLIRERAAALLAAHVENISDPFAVSELTSKDVREDGARLPDEANALSMMGGNRAVWVKDATDAVAGAFADLLAGDPIANLVVVEAGELTTRSKLRKDFESHNRAAAIGCYADDRASVQSMLNASFSQAGIRVAPDAMNYLADRLGNDRLVSRQEIEKLILFAGDQRELSLNDIIAAIGDNALHPVDEVVYRAMEGDTAALDSALQGAIQEGAAAVQILRAAQSHLQRLHLVTAKIAKGMPADRAVQELRPPVFYKFKSRFQNQSTRWRPALINRAMEILLEAEGNCKKTGAPVEAICHLGLMKICSAAARHARR